MSKKFSFIITCRDDNYGDNKQFHNRFINTTFINRLEKQLKTNIKNILKYFKEDEFEILIVDWSPLDGKYLHKNKEIEDILKLPYIKNVIVDSTAVLHMGCKVESFYEAFSKNVGIRQAEGEFILLTNADIILDDVLIQETCNVIKNCFDSDKYYWRCHSRKDVDFNLNLIEEGLSFGNNKGKDYFFRTKGNGEIDIETTKPPNVDINDILFDMYLGGPAAGDYLLINREIIINKGRGYDESNSFRLQGGEKYTPTSKIRTYNSSQDGEILFNLYKNGISPRKLNGSVLHLDHAKAPVSPNIYNKSGYENNKNWGLIDVKKEKINDNTYRLFM